MHGLCCKGFGLYSWSVYVMWCVFETPTLSFPLYIFFFPSFHFPSFLLHQSFKSENLFSAFMQFHKILCFCIVLESEVLCPGLSLMYKHDWSKKQKNKTKNNLFIDLSCSFSIRLFPFFHFWNWPLISSEFCTVMIIISVLVLVFCMTFKLPAWHAIDRYNFIFDVLFFCKQILFVKKKPQ